CMFRSTFPFSLQSYFLFLLFALLIVCVSCGNNLDGFVNSGATASGTDSSNSNVPNANDPGIAPNDPPDVKSAKESAAECRQYGFSDDRIKQFSLVSTATIIVSKIVAHGDG